MLRIGCHLSSSKGYRAMAKDAKKINANTFQFFTRNPRGGNAKAIDENDVKVFLTEAQSLDITPILAHAPYTLNACSADPKLRDFAKRTMADDLVRMEYTPGNMYNFHPGSHVKQGTEIGIQFIAEMLNEILSPAQTTTVLLETMAGKGSEVGGAFEELRQIENYLGHAITTTEKSRITCSIGIASAGDVRKEEDINELIRSADEILYKVKTGEKGHYAFL